MSSEQWKQQIEYCLAQIKLRHQPAFEELYQLTSGKLYGLILKIVPDKELAADVLQEAYTKIWMNSERYRHDLGGGWPWICQLTRNCAIDRVRSSSRQPEQVDIAVIDEETASDDLLRELTDDSSNLWLQHHDLSRCLQKIRKEPRSVIISAYIYGLSHSELAIQLQKPLGTLKSWIRRGLKELHQCLEA
ncbi:RNA polymerase sigma factor [Motiliproteus sp. MSK22-1]|uniref:RNA polymerase sigma factor n=1 Tax=Motiliproteus sp. MSK22-1 TaxID=1897630 RepID=UPI000975F2D0|nr:sigma-70 family RNA polymerase sigma factor [Motiliproteus sp. MSK22-1]OMH33618.1 RNA polymerase subunit sigma-70 [Motiliproteus sp. MSK22-1]